MARHWTKYIIISNLSQRGLPVANFIDCLGCGLKSPALG